ncbi:MAG: energy transducer TonB [Candidatus Latescibacteria bacterium]|nr:energy transducer TonB [Candidatus Latescibacterota bacterium]
MNRRAATTGGFTTSVVVHAAIFLLLALMMREGARQAGETFDELTEIAYIEARYGEDVAQQVRVKTQPVVQPKQETPAESKLEETPVPQPETPQPALQSRPLLQTLPNKLATRPLLQSRQAADVDAPRLTSAQQRQFLDTTSRQLDSRTFADAAPRLDTRNLRDPSALAADANAPRLTSREAQAAFQGNDVALVGRKSSVDLSEVDFEVGQGGASSGGGRMALQLATGGSETGHAGLVGGRLEEGQTAYQGSVAALVQTAKDNERRAAAAIDVAAPARSASTQGRATILDYGPGGSTGATGQASLRGRQQAPAETPTAAAVAEATSKPTAPPQTQLAETQAKAMGGKGVSMTISGQISDRKVTASAMPVYSEAARKAGWEGVVAVHFTVLPDGRVKDNMYFDQTSAHRDLNRAAMEAVKQFRFEPLSGADRVEQWGVITIVFRLS